MKPVYKVAILGKNGYVGKELMSLVDKHPYLQRLDLDTLDVCVNACTKLDVVFLATPIKASMDAVLKLISIGVHIIDLSGAFRLPEAQFTQWYGMQHEAASLISKACYGLSPWANFPKEVQLIANPGCYATAALMALLPLCKARVIDSSSIIIDAKSGVSGGGKKATNALMFAEMANNFYPYKVGKHQHTPEIEKALLDLSGQQSPITLTTAMLPLVRGIAMTIYVKAASVFSSEKALAQSIFQAFETAYANYPFVVYKEIGQGEDDEDQKILALQTVIHTPHCHIGFFVKKEQIILFSAIDNLLKGAASQAIENLNSLYHLPLQTGLLL